MSKDDTHDSVEFPKKYNDVLKHIPEFKDTADTASTEDLKKMIVTCEGNLYEIAKAKEADEKLNAAKEIVKDLSGPYNDAKKVQEAKIQYVLFLLENKGVELGDKEEDES